MLLCIDVGNSQMYGGVFRGETLCLRFRLTSKQSSSDEFGTTLKAVLRENNCAPESIQHIAICSVVPPLDYSLRSACIKYFSIAPFFLQANVKTGLKIAYKNPVEVGADRIANAIGATALFPHKNLIVLDFGTALTLCAINKDRTYLGGAIMPGMRLSMEALVRNTAKLSAVEIIRPQEIIGQSTSESIQAGIYYGALGACKELILQVKNNFFEDDSPLVLATGGFSSLFEQLDLYDHWLPDLVLHGLKIAFYHNMPESLSAL